LDVTALVTPVAVLIMVTLALAMTAAEVSVTKPSIDCVVD
jgi:hypothetical protein